MNLAQNDVLRNKIRERMDKIFEKQSALITDASERGMIIDPTRLSKYFKGKSGGLTEEQVLWVATRLGIFVNLNFGVPTLDGTKLKYEIPEYSEIECLKRIKKIFGK